MDSFHEEDNNPFSGTPSHLFASTMSHGGGGGGGGSSAVSDSLHGSIHGSSTANSIGGLHDEDDNNPHHYGYPSFHHQQQQQQQQQSGLLSHLESSASAFNDHINPIVDNSLPESRISHSIFNQQQLPNTNEFLDQSSTLNHSNNNITNQSSDAIRYEYGDTLTNNNIASGTLNDFTSNTNKHREGSITNSSTISSAVFLDTPTHETERDSYYNQTTEYDDEEDTRTDYEGLLNQSRHTLKGDGEDESEDDYYGEIFISDAGQMKDMNGNTVVMYVIKYEDLFIRRRYSEFDNFRASLRRLFPTVIIPPIPEKHTMINYFLNPLNAKNDQKIIEKRKRLLTVFLQGCLSVKQIRQSKLWSYFMNPNMTWNDIASSPPISILPMSNLLAPPLDPVKPSPLHLLLPLPQSTNTSPSFRANQTATETELDHKFKDYQQIFQHYKKETSKLEKSAKKQKRHFKALTKDLGELGAFYNAFSLEDHDHLSSAIEKTGQAIDINFINSENFTLQILTILEEPLFEFNQMSSETLNVLKFRKLKEIQHHIIKTTINKRQSRIKELKSAQEQSRRLEEILRQNATQSPTIAAAVKRLEQGENINHLNTGVNVSPWRRIFTGTASKPNSYTEITTMTEDERQEEAAKIEKELVKLEDCLNIVSKDLKDINKSLSENIETLLHGFNEEWKAVMKRFTAAILEYLRENLETWKIAKAEIEGIKIDNPREIPKDW